MFLVFESKMVTESSAICLRAQGRNTCINRAKLSGQARIGELKAYLKEHEDLYRYSFGNRPVEVVFLEELLEDDNGILQTTPDRIEF